MQAVPFVAIVSPLLHVVGPIYRDVQTSAVIFGGHELQLRSKKKESHESLSLHSSQHILFTLILATVAEVEIAAGHVYEGG